MYICTDEILSGMDVSLLGVADIGELIAIELLFGGIINFFSTRQCFICPKRSEFDRIGNKMLRILFVLTPGKMLIFILKINVP